MAFLRIVLGSTLLAILYGIVHDQITVRICLEYFTIGHPKVIESEDPTLLALTWGVLATWWVGLLLGLMLACAARVGPWPKRTFRDLLRPILWLLAGAGAVALLAGLLGWWLASAGAVRLLPPMADRVPTDRHVAFLTDLWAHLGAYAAAALGGLWLTGRTILRRRPAVRT